MSVTLDEVRQVALGLPEVSEQPHHDLVSFRVRGKIITTVPDGGTRDQANGWHSFRLVRKVISEG